MSDRYFKEHIFSHPPDEGHIGNSSDFVIRWHPSRGQLRVDGLKLHPERWKSHKQILHLSFGTSGEWQSVRSVSLEIFYQVDLFLLRYGALDITAGDKYCGTLQKKKPVRFPCILRCMDFESRNTKLYASGSIFSKAIQRTKPDSHDAIIVIARKKRYTCAVASLQSPVSDSHRFVFTECNR